MQDNLYNLAFERTLLCSIIFEPQIFEELSPPIKVNDFYLPTHQAIYEAIQILDTKNLPIDEEFIKKELIKLKMFDEQVMLEILVANPVANINAYCEEIKEKSKQRELLNLTTAIKRSIVEDMDSADETINKALKQIKQIEDNDSTGYETQNLSEAIKEFESMPKKPKYETGISAIDTHFNGGLELAQLVMVGGEKGVGKTAFLLQFLYNVSMGFKCAFLSYEMPKWKIASRARLAKLQDTQKNNMFILDKGRDITQIEKSVKTLAKSGFKFFTIDSLMKISNKHFVGKRNEQISDITDRLSKLCIELDIIIILIVQVSKEDLKSGYMAVKGSGDADYDSDIMFFIKKDKENEKKRIFICEKNRQNGNEFKEDMYFNPQKVILQQHAPTLYEATYTTSVSDSPKIEMETL